MRQLHRWQAQLNNEIKSKDTFAVLCYYLQGHRNGGSCLSCIRLVVTSTSEDQKYQEG